MGIIMFIFQVCSLLNGKLVLCRKKEIFADALSEKLSAPRKEYYFSFIFP